MATKSRTTDAIQISAIKMQTVIVILFGTTGLYCHRMSAKAKQQLMIGGRKKTAAEKLEIKHHPREEFKDSMYVSKGTNKHSHIQFPSMAVKSAMGTAALVIPGITKTQVQRLVFMPHEMIPIFGIPKLRMDIVRSSDINRTPDVRTRAFIHQWAAEIEIRYSTPSLSQKAILTLLHNAGILVGIGDNRQEKGKGSYGTFRLYDKEFNELPAEMLDAKAQWEAIQNPQPENIESEELLAEFDHEIEQRA